MITPCKCCRNFCKEFKEYVLNLSNFAYRLRISLNSFALRGNVFDLAVGFIIANAFNNVVQSLVDDVLTPPFGLFFDGVDFGNLTIKMNNFVRPNQLPVVIRYGKFLQTVLHLLIIVFCLFLVVKFINNIHRLAMKRKLEQETVELEENNEQLKVLKEIRDLLARKPTVQLKHTH